MEHFNDKKLEFALELLTNVLLSLNLTSSSFQTSLLLTGKKYSENEESSKLWPILLQKSDHTAHMVYVSFLMGFAKEKLLPV